MAALETEFSKKFRSFLDDLGWDVIRQETKLDDGLPDYLVVAPTRQVSWVELKWVEPEGHSVRLKTLQASQTNFLRERRLKSPNFNSCILAATRKEGLLLLPASTQIKWTVKVRSQFPIDGDEYVDVLRCEDLDEVSSYLSELFCYA